MPKTALQVLEDAARIFDNDTNRWTNGDASEARDRWGVAVKASNFQACQFTPYGACKLAGNGQFDDWATAYAWLKLQAARSSPHKDLYAWNNAPGRSIEDVRELFKQTIELVKSKG